MNQTPSPIQSRLIKLYQATRVIKDGADFHEAMLTHAQEIDKVLAAVAAAPKPVAPDGQPIPGPGNPAGPAPVPE